MTQTASVSSINSERAGSTRADKAIAFYKTAATLVLLAIAFPLNVTLVLLALGWGLVSWPFRQQRSASGGSKTVMISGGKMTKALQIARSMNAAGHRVILVETHKYWLSGHRFSNAVDRFFTVPAPQEDGTEYARALAEIAEREGVDIYIPVCSPVASYFDSLAKPELSQWCEVFHFDADTTRMLDDKYDFAEAARKIGLSVPKSFKITDPNQVLNFDFSNESHPYILKSIPYDSVRRLDLTKLPCETPEATADFVHQLPISSEKPWIMQEFIQGKELCTHSTIRDGEIRLHCCSDSSAFQVNYEHRDRPQILNWVTHFAEAYQFTGQFSLDFIEAEDGTPYAIECNPRTHSAITMFYNHSGVANAFIGAEKQIRPLEPLPTSKPTYWIYHEVWRLITSKSIGQFFERLAIIGNGTDAI
ncbi:MAG: ATP-grasp enzyme [Cyanobacteria bacterium J06639_1]